MEASRTDNLQLAALFRSVARLLARAYHGPRHGRGGHHAQGRLLAAIRENGPVSQGDLLRFMGVRSSSLSELLAKLERGGLIRRERNPEDKRSFIVTATPAADDLLDDRDGHEQAFADRVFACLDEEEKQALSASLQKIAGALGEEPESGPMQGRCSRGRDRGFGKGPGKGRGGRFGGRGGR